MHDRLLDARNPCLPASLTYDPRNDVAATPFIGSGAAPKVALSHLAKAGKPMARLVPLVAAPTRRRLGLFKGELNVPDDFDAPLAEGELASFEGR